MNTLKQIIIVLVLILGVWGISSAFFSSENEANIKIAAADKVEAVPLSEAATSQINSETEFEQEALSVSANNHHSQLADSMPVATTKLLKAGGLELPIVFENVSISDELKKIITEDIHLIYGSSTNHSFYAGKSRAGFTLGSQHFDVTRYINMDGVKYFPEEHQDEFGQITQLDGEDALVISDNLIGSYEEAYERKKQNPVIYEKLDHFIQKMNELNKMKPSELLPLREMFYLSGNAQYFEEALNDNRAAEFIKDYGGQFYRQPSILDVRPANEANQFVAKMYVTAGGNGLEETVPFIWDKDRWKLLIIIPGT